jgi:tetratricopeptide (TPR) repeat protein
VAVISTAAVAHGRYVPLLPVLALYRDYFGIGERDPPELAREQIETTMLALDPAFTEDLPLLFEFLGVPDPDRPLGSIKPRERQRQLLDLLTRTVEARSGHEAAVLVVEDLHWIDDASAGVLEGLVAVVPGTRTLLVSTYRPEHDAAWASTGQHAEIVLAPLDADATGTLLAELLGRDASLEGLKALIRARAGGNPFFIEEIVQALAENGHLAGGRGKHRLVDELESLDLPVTVQAGLAARIDRLPTREKALLQTMSVIGTEIPGPLLSEVSELGARELADALDVLARAQWVVRTDATAGREYAFKHPLTQEVAYGSQLSEPRARAHRAVAAAIEQTYPDGLDERAALLAHHCEASGDKLAGARWHARAATWTERRSLPDSLRHWRRVRHLVSELEASPEREALATKARIGILSLVWRLGTSPDEAAAIRAEGRADAEQARLDLYSAGTLMHSGREREGLDGFRQVSRDAVAAGDPGSALTASIGVAYASWLAGSVSEGVETIDRALPAAAGDPMIGSGMAFLCPLAHAYGHRGKCRGYVGELGEAHDDFDSAIALASTHDDAETVCATYANLAHLEADIGEYEAALRNAARGLEIGERSGNVVHIIACTVPAAVAQAGAGRFADALTMAESDLATVRQHRVGLY